MRPRSRGDGTKAAGVKPLDAIWEVSDELWAKIEPGLLEVAPLPPAGVGWEWQNADGALGKARFGGDEVGSNPTDPGKNGTKRSVIVDEPGDPFKVRRWSSGRVSTTPKFLSATIAAIVVEHLTPSEEETHHRCLEGFDNPIVREMAAAHGHRPTSAGSGRRRR